MSSSSPSGIVLGSAVPADSSESELVRLSGLLRQAGEATHDFNNLLGVIVGNVDLLAEQPGWSPENRALLDEVLTASLRASEQVRGLLLALRSERARPAAEDPLAASSATVPESIERTTARRSGDQKVVLAVDDNARLRQIVVRQLTGMGYRVIEAADGPAALMVLNSEPVDLLFTDVVMPGGMSGFDLARLVLSRWPSMKALITSGFPELEPSLESLSAGQLMRLNKPYTSGQLAAALERVLQS